MNLFNIWKDKASEYADVRLRLLKLGIIERTSTLLGNLIITFIYFFVALAVLTFLGFGLMETFSSLLDSRVGGAFSTAGVFMLLLVLLFVLRKAIIGAFANVFIRVLTEGDEDDDDPEDEHHRSIRVEGDE